MLKRILVGMITVYQRVISPAFPPRCRFYPTCSQYSKEAILKYGAGKGTYLAVRRIMRCHPRNPGGYDPVP
ncbi:membrane protein insertion efficiency factor YidD [Candidatus Acetothermia bacterium]|nr:MAG: membrane protein insertion efficiency factor YidD [Candidatus Acetothermia bacterium]